MNSPTPRRPLDAAPVFFLDRNFGKKMALALMEAGLPVERHDAHFPWNTPDVTWLPIVGAKAWVILTKDQNIRRNALERMAARRARARMFILTAGQMSDLEHARTFIAALPKVFRFLMKHHAPFIATVSRGGAVSLVCP